MKHCQICLHRNNSPQTKKDLTRLLSKTISSTKQLDKESICLIRVQHVFIYSSVPRHYQIYANFLVNHIYPASIYGWSEKFSKPINTYSNTYWWWWFGRRHVSRDKRMHSGWQYARYLMFHTTYWGGGSELILNIIRYYGLWEVMGRPPIQSVYWGGGSELILNIIRYYGLWEVMGRPPIQSVYWGGGSELILNIIRYYGLWEVMGRPPIQSVDNLFHLFIFLCENKYFLISDIHVFLTVLGACPVDLLYLP